MFAIAMDAFPVKIAQPPPPYGQHADGQGRVLDYVRDRIALGRWRPGAELPHRDWFEARFGLSSRTVNKAFATLSSDGWVRAVPHVGTRVADALPFRGRYLLVLNPGVAALSQAWRLAAAALAARRGVAFEEMSFPGGPGAEEKRAAIAAAIRTHRWEGVVFCNPMTNMGAVLRRIRNVPVFGFALLNFREAGRYTAGSQENFGWAIDKEAGREAEIFFEECRRRGLRRVAILYSRLDYPGRDQVLREAAARHGLEAGPYHIQAANPDKGRNHLVEPLLRLMLRPDDPWKAEAVILTDDMFVPPLESALLGLYGEEGLGKVAVFAHGNRPGLPETRLKDLVFHGVDVAATLSGFLDFAQACAAGRRKWVELPGPVFF